MQPLSDYFGKIIDCRKVVFDCRFFHLTKNKKIQLFDSFFNFVNSAFSEECVLNWKFDNKVVRDQNNLYQKLQNENDETIYMDVIGDVKCNRIYNKITLNQYDRDLKYRLPLFTTLSIKYSVDYLEYFKAKIEPYVSLNSIIELKNSINNVFDLEYRVNKNVYSDHAIRGNCFSAKSHKNDDEYYGEISLWISYFSIHDEVNHLAKSLYEYGVKIATEFADTNVTIKVNQSCSNILDSRLFFRSLIANADQSPTSREQSMLANYMYLQDIGWANIISPYTARLLDIHQHGNTKYNLVDKNQTYVIHMLKNGAISIQNKRDIEETTILDIKSIKSIAYRALYPGIGRFQLTWPYWRSNWENVPILPEELKTEDKQIVFQHKGTVNPLFLLA